MLCIGVQSSSISFNLLLLCGGSPVFTNAFFMCWDLGFMPHLSFDLGFLPSSLLAYGFICVHVLGCLFQYLESLSHHLPLWADLCTAGHMSPWNQNKRGNLGSLSANAKIHTFTDCLVLNSFLIRNIIWIFFFHNGSGSEWVHSKLPKLLLYLLFSKQKKNLSLAPNIFHRNRRY